MDSTDSLKIDADLARFLAAFDQEIDGGDARAPTVHVPLPPGAPGRDATEYPVTPLRGRTDNEGSLGEVLPDAPRPRAGYSNMLGPNGGPHRVGRFELRRQLGKGGCGIVFLAYDPKLEREVALKIPRPEMLMNPDAKRRLIREAMAAAEFDHPNLVPVFETGELGPVCFIATAYCPGPTLAEWIDRQAFPVPARQAARLVATIAEAVQHAHDRGVLHRDLKPNNILLQEVTLAEGDEPPPGSVALRGETVLPRLVDFGLAKLAERGGPSETATRQILGTPKYMAPEQAQARREDIGPPADVYGLGVILYELLAGRAPYDGATDVEVLRQAVEGKPVAPRDLRPDLPRDLEAICQKAMARTTAARYRTAIDLADDLRRFLDGRPTVARPLRWSGRAVRWLRRNDQLVAIAVLAVTVLFLITLGSLATFQSRQFRKDRDNVLNDQANRNRADQEREYARQTRVAFLAWRGGDNKSALAALDAAKRAASATMDVPDFTHEYLARLAKTERLVIVCPAGPVTALAVSPDGTRLASGHETGALCVWDRATGNELGTIKAHDGPVARVAFALDGTLLLSLGPAAKDAKQVLCWVVTKGGAPHTPKQDHVLLAGAECFTVSADGRTLYTGGAAGMLTRRVLPAGRTEHKPASRGTTVRAIAASADGRCVITVDHQQGVDHWSSDLQHVRHEDGAGSPVTALCVRARGAAVLGLASGDVVVHADNGTTARPVVFSARATVGWIATNAERVAFNGGPGRVVIDGTDIATGDSGEIAAGAFSADGKTLFTGSADGTIRAWDVARDARDRGAARPDPGRSLGVATDGTKHVFSTRALVTRSDTGFFDAPAHTREVVRLLDDGTMRGVWFENRAVVVGDMEMSPKGEKITAERLRAAVPGGRAPVVAALSADGTTLVVGDDDGRVTSWSVPEKRALNTFDTGLRRPVGRAVLTSDGRHVAVPVAGGVGVWAVGFDERVARADAADGAAFAFVAGAERIAVAGRDGAARVWNFNGGDPVVLHGHVGRVTGVGCSPDGRTLVTGTGTGAVHFWDLRTGQELMSLRRHSRPVTIIEFAAGGKVLVTAGDGQLAVWDARE